MMYELTDKNGKVHLVHKVDLMEWINAKAVSSYVNDKGNRIDLEDKGDGKVSGKPDKADKGGAEKVRV